MSTKPTSEPCGGCRRDVWPTMHIHQKANVVAFGETFIANPDLPARFTALAPIQRSDRALHYAKNDRTDG